ncbi:MAG: TonB-dependent receptor [Bacteroidales bacterium]|nr:TonB-dependent receptor [Bacteroidales bacterium]
MRKLLLLKKVVLACAMTLFSLSVFAQAHQVSGVVTDETNQTVPGVAVMIKGTSTGTVTDMDGKYTIQAADGDVLVFSFIGYSNQEQTVSGSTVNANMEPEAINLNEIVAVGYGVQKKSDLTGAVASVNSDDIKNLSTTDAASALQGKAAGVQILNYSGAPGEGAAIRVRGYSSNSGELGPLLIVDGLKVDNIQYLDPSMIQSMEILKDAASAAIYGAEAGNGVVLITTKAGAEGKGTINYSYKMTRSNLAKKPDVMNRNQFIEFMRMKGVDIDGLMKDNGDDGRIDTDWADELFETGIGHQHNLSVAGGNKNGKYFFALNYVTEDGMVVGNKDKYERLTAQINADYKIKDWLQVGTTNSIEKWATKSVSHMSETNSVMMSVFQNDPLTPVYYNSLDDFKQATRDVYNDPAKAGDDYKAFTDKTKYPNDFLVTRDKDGRIFAVSKYVDNDHGSPLIQLYRGNESRKGFTIRGTAFANLMPVKGLTITSRLGYRIGYSNTHNFTTPYYANSMAKANQYTISAADNTNYYYQWENFANYSKTFAMQHTLVLMAGMSYIENRNDNVNGSAQGPDILSAYEPNFQYLNYVNANDNTKKSFGNAPGRSANTSYYGRLTYSFANKYSLQANFRADAFDSSKLPSDKRWGKFPSFSAGWTLSNESFIQDNISPDILSFLKIRASWGRNGNINVLRNYPYSTTIALNSQFYQYDVKAGAAPSYGSKPSGLANPDLKWETSEQIDLGLDARFLNSRLTFTLDYYKKTTKDLLVSVNPVPEVGVSSTTVNGGDVENSGIEIELGWKDKIEDFSYSFKANFSTNKNELTKLNNTIPRLQYGSYYVSQLRTVCQVGDPLWCFYGYKFDKVNSEDGTYKLVDLNNDGLINDDDKTNIGSGMPKANVGFTLELGYKGFDFTMLGAGSFGQDIFPVLYRTDRPLNNTLDYYRQNTWTENNKGAKMPSMKVVANDTQFWASDANVFKGNFFKFRQLQLGYTLPNDISRKALMENVRVFVSLDNFFTITNYPGLDPETACTKNAEQLGVDLGTYPTAKKFVFGVNLSF